MRNNGKLHIRKNPCRKLLGNMRKKTRKMQKNIVWFFLMCNLQFFTFFRIYILNFSHFYIINTMFFFAFFDFFAYFLKVFGQDFSWSVHRTQYTALRVTVFCSVHTSGTKSWPKTCSKYAKNAKNAKKNIVCLM